jgi:hypothetical protein
MFGYRRRFFAPGGTDRLLALDVEQACEWTFLVRALSDMFRGHKMQCDIAAN